MKFTFGTYQRDNGYVKVHVSTSTGSYGGVIMLAEEWDALRAILIHGRTWFQRGEVEVHFLDDTSTPAFVKGE